MKSVTWSKKYSKGIFRIKNDSCIILYASYEGSFNIPPVSWVPFDGKILAFKKNKLYYETYELKKHIK